MILYPEKGKKKIFHKERKKKLIKKKKVYITRPQGKIQ